jgi:threonine synthase
MTKYYSTNREVPEVDLAQALMQGQAGDRGLFLPTSVPVMTRELLSNARDMSYPDLAAAVLGPYADGVFSRDALEEICHEAYNFDVPIEKVTGQSWVMRLDRGPTASFKDFAARFMGLALGRLVRERNTDLLILTATSGDTGSAVAHAFLGVEGIQVLVLFPREEVSDRQRKPVEGKFDECQALVKRAFADPDLTDLNLSSANSINIGRLLPQSVYYVYSASRLADIAGGEGVVFSVPSGNFGDLMGGVLAFRGGLPVSRFVVATNSNDEVPRFFASGVYKKIDPSLVCISNAMNVGHPSNLARLVALYGGWMDEVGTLHSAPDLEAVNRDFYGISISDDETRATIGRVFRDYGVMLEPHGAVGWAGLTEYLGENPDTASRTSISLETAHPAKFPEEIRAITGQDPVLPPSLEGLDEREEVFGEMDLDYARFKNHLVSEYRS